MAKKTKGAVEKIALQCPECKRRNYTTEKNRRNIQGKMELKNTVNGARLQLCIKRRRSNKFPGQ
jgi:ribosomal protein L33